MTAVSDKARERALYLISPIALLLVWQLLLMAGIGDRRFIPAPTDIAVRLGLLIENGELAWHTGATLWRVFAGFFLGSVPAVAVGLLMAMFKPVRIFVDPLIAAIFPDPEDRADAAVAAGVRLRRRLQDRAGCDRGVLSGRRQHLHRRRQYRENLLGRGQELRREPDWSCSPASCSSARCRRFSQGLRIALAVSFIVLVASEFVASKTGLGFMIWNSWELLQVDIMFVGIVTIGVLGLITSVLFQEIERKVIPWKAE